MTRIRVTFWGLVVTTILASGALARALDAPPAASTGVAVAATGVVAAVAGALALRIAVVVARHQQGHRLRTGPRKE